MYNSDFSSIIQVVLIRFIYVIGLMFIIGNSNFTKQKKKAKNKIANVILIIISTVVLLGKLRGEIAYMHYYTESLVSSISVLFDIILAIILIVLVVEVCKNKNTTLESKIIRTSIFTGIVTFLLHLKFFGYANSYVMICSQNEIPTFSIIIMQLFVLVLIFKYLKEIKNKEKDNTKIFFLILLYFTLTSSRIHVLKNISLKSYLDIILDITDDMIINITAMGLFAYILNMINFPNLKINKNDEEIENDKLEENETTILESEEDINDIENSNNIKKEEKQ